MFATTRKKRSNYPVGATNGHLTPFKQNNDARFAAKIKQRRSKDACFGAKCKLNCSNFTQPIYIYTEKKTHIFCSIK